MITMESKNTLAYLYRFPNVCVLQLTRESVQTAVVNGITAEQILHYLRANAHPDMLKSVSITRVIDCWQCIMALS